jgi:hypothetical protein
MKKLLYFLISAATLSWSCSDQNDVVRDLIEEAGNRAKVYSFPYTLTAADYGAIATAALADAGDDAEKRALANAVRSTNSLNPFASPMMYIPPVLKSKYPALGRESAIQVTYDYTVQERTTVTEQYVYDGTQWIFDPTINYTMVSADHKMVIDHMLEDPEMSVFVNQQYKNEEFYYGFGSRYSNVSLRLSSRVSYTRDTELHALGSDDEKIAFLWNRLQQKGMPLFLRLKYPLSPSIAQGVQLYYNITVAVYFPDGVTNSTKNYMMRYRVATAGSTGTPATFEYVSTTPLP